MNFIDSIRNAAEECVCPLGWTKLGGISTTVFTDNKSGYSVVVLPKNQAAYAFDNSATISDIQAPNIGKSLAKFDLSNTSTLDLVVEIYMILGETRGLARLSPKSEPNSVKEVIESNN